jgi:large subunit ribosomal protein L19
MSGGTGVERIFPLASPFLEKIVVNKEGAVRRSRLFYLRERTGKSARIKEKKTFSKKIYHITFSLAFQCLKLSFQNQ